jgi:hypothetical protein
MLSQRVFARVEGTQSESSIPGYFSRLFLPIAGEADEQWAVDGRIAHRLLNPAI